MNARTSVLSRFCAVMACASIIGLASAAELQDPPPAPAIQAKPGTPPVLTSYSTGMQEVIQLAQASLSKDVLVAFINNSPIPYHPTPDEIIYLNDLGVSDEVITALLKKGASAPGPVPPGPAPAPAPAPQNPPPGAPGAPGVFPPGAFPQGVPQPATPAPGFPGAPQAGSAPYVPNAPAVDGPPAGADAVSPTFTGALSPYGNWVSVPEYGTVWQPAVALANPGWRPYVDNGHWVYTDSGWYWHSDYSWGWAPFHYGRWTRAGRYGWVWLPGANWGPAWVSWRYSEGYCGWAPLPPAAQFDVGVGLRFNGVHVGADFDFGLADSFYAFVPVGHFCDPYPWRFVVGFDVGRRLFRSSLVFNNYGFRGGVVINEGFGRDRIALAAHIDIPIVRIAESRGFVRGGFRRGEVINVFRPRVDVRFGGRW